MISVVITTKNEAGGIDRVLKEALPYADEILVVDGRSTDGTREIAEAMGVRVVLDNGRGKGDAAKVGIREARGDVIVFMCADGSDDPRNIPRLVEPIFKGEADLVVGSRFKGGSDEWKGDLSTYLRAVGAGLLTIAINYRWHSQITDCLNAFRAIRRDVALKLPLKANDFDIEQHMVVACLKKGYRVTEVASHEYARAWGKSKLPTYRKAYLFFWRLFLDLVTP